MHVAVITNLVTLCAQNSYTVPLAHACTNLITAEYTQIHVETKYHNIITIHGAKYIMA